MRSAWNTGINLLHKWLKTEGLAKKTHTELIVRNGLGNLQKGIINDT